MVLDPISQASSPTQEGAGVLETHCISETQLLALEVERSTLGNCRLVSLRVVQEGPPALVKGCRGQEAVIGNPSGGHESPLGTLADLDPPRIFS